MVHIYYHYEVIGKCKVFLRVWLLYFYSVNTLNNEDYFLPGVRGVTVLLLLPGCRAAVMNGWRWGAILL